MKDNRMTENTRIVIDPGDLPRFAVRARLEVSRHDDPGTAGIGNVAFGDTC